MGAAGAMRMPWTASVRSLSTNASRESAGEGIGGWQRVAVVSSPSSTRRCVALGPQVALAVLLTPLEHREVLRNRLVLIERNALTPIFFTSLDARTRGGCERLPGCIVMLS